jgi:poly(A) polymerase
MTRPVSERDFAVEVVRRLRERGYEALWAGGCVRDELLGLVPRDYDVATSARPEQVQGLFRRTIAVGAAFGVIEVLGPRTRQGPLRVQVATFRSDVRYTDGRHPDAVVYSTAQEDAQRRDFTINGMFFDPLAGRLIDYVGGQDDLRARLIRAIGEPDKRFEEDRLRMLRAVRMAARFDFAIHPDTTAAVARMAPGIAVVSAERVADELRKVLVDRHRARGLRLFLDLGLAAVLLPELVKMRGFPYGLPRPDGPGLPPPGKAGPVGPGNDLWEHTLAVLDLLGPPEDRRDEPGGSPPGGSPPGGSPGERRGLSPPSFPLAFAALLHDVGKPRTVGRTPDRYTFHGHEHVGRRLAGEVCLRLKLSNDERERVEWLVEKHQVLADAPRMRASKLKVLLIHPGIEELFALHRADALAAGRDTAHVEYAERRREEWSASGELNPPPLITGHDLLSWGIAQGPVFKRLLDAVREAQLESNISTPEQAKALVERLLAEDSGAEPRRSPDEGEPPSSSRWEDDRC